MNKISPELSFIVPVFNAEETLLESLRRIHSQEFPSPFEIVIVDDGSTDRSYEIAREWAASVEVKREKVSVNLFSIPHAGEAAAMNAGIQAAQAPIIAWVESDVELEPDWLRTLTPELEEEGIAGAGGWLLPAENGAAIAQIFGYEIAYKIRTNPPYPRHVTSANAIYKKSIFEELGLCREDLAESSFDSEYNQRILERGYRLKFNPNAIARHHFKSRFIDCLRRTVWYGYKRPFVKGQVLYPFDWWSGITALTCGFLLPAFIAVWYSPFIALICLAACVGAHILYSFILFQRFKKAVLLLAAPVFFIRNGALLLAYAYGWIIKLLQSQKGE